MKDKRLLVVPQRTSQTPPDAHVGLPTMFIPKKTLIEISCVFTWDKSYCELLHKQWEARGYKVVTNGPAFGSCGNQFEPGRFVKKGIIHTSRGCPKQCPWCYVPRREGKIRHLWIHEGNIIQDNNLLACNHSHVEAVFQMLRKQKAIRFLGGLDCALITDWVIEELRSLRIKEIWIAYDNERSQEIVRRAINKLKGAGFSRDKIRCYILAGFDFYDDCSRAEERARWVWNQGAMPFMQLYDRSDDIGKYWARMVRKWQRPAIMRTRMKNKTWKSIFDESKPPPGVIKIP